MRPNTKQKIVSPDLVTDLPIELVVKFKRKLNFPWNRIWINCDYGQDTFDLTSMRKDVETFGRKAKVNFPQIY